MAEKYSFIVVKYPKRDTGEAALAVVVGLSKEKLIKLKDAVAITKTEKGKIKLHQTKDDGAKKGFLKGGAVGVLFAVLLGPAGWIAAGAALGTAFSLFDRGIKNKLLKELGENMTPEESAVAVLVEEADWNQVFSRMQSYNFNGQIVVQELLEQDAVAFEDLVNAASAPAPIPEEVVVDAAEFDALVDAAPAPDVPPDDFQRLEGIGPATAAALNQLGVTTYTSLAAYDPRQLEADLTASGAKIVPGSLLAVPAQAALAAAGRWNAVKYVQDEVIKGRRLTLPDNLTRINGVGRGVVTRLDEMGITTFKQLRDADPDQLESELRASGLIIPKGSVALWHAQAVLAADNRWDDLKNFQDELAQTPPPEAATEDEASAATEATDEG